MLFDISKHISKPISGILQVGAHYGNEYNILKKICSNILMFEPQKNVFEILNKKLSFDKDVILENKALGSVSGEYIMYTEQSNNGQSSSLLEPKLHKIQYPNIEFNSLEKVEVTTLNEYFLNKKFNYNLILLDVQGYELEVLKGASNILNTVDYILCEVNNVELYAACPLIDDIDNYLIKFNFKRFTTFWDPEAGTWGDALYIRENNT
jgi:FkbM family methyltransferase